MKNNVGTEKKKAIVMLVIAGLILFTIPVLMWQGAVKVQKLVDQYYSYFKEGETNVIYLGKQGCGYCTQFSPILTSVSDEFDVPYNYIDITQISTTKVAQMLEKAGIDPSKFGTPTVIITKDGKAVASKIGMMDREGLFKFFQENGLIAGDVVLPKEHPNLTDIVYSDFENLLKGKEKSLVVIGQTGCGACTAAKPVLDEIAEEYGITINYLNYTNMSIEEKKALDGALPYFKENPTWGTPLFLVVKENELVGVNSGFRDKSTVLDFLKTYDLINE